MVRDWIGGKLSYGLIYFHTTNVKKSYDNLKLFGFLIKILQTYDEFWQDNLKLLGYLIKIPQLKTQNNFYYLVR